MAEDINLPNLVSHLQVNLENTSGIVAEASRQGSSVGAALGESFQRRVQAAINDIPPVVIDDDSSQFDRDLDRIRTELRELDDQRIGVDISVEDALRQLDRLEPHLERLSREHPNVDVRASVGEAVANLADLRAAAAAVPDEIHVDVDLDAGAAIAEAGLLRRVFDRVGNAGRGLGSTIGSSIASIAPTLAKATAGLGSAIPLVAGLASTLAQVAPAAGVAATGLLAAGTAGVALKIGLSGVGDAVKAAFSEDDPKKLAKAIEKLSPAAQKFIGVLQGLKPELHALQQGTQERLFTGLDTALKRAATSTLPVFRTALYDAAGTLNLMGRNVLSTATDLSDSGTLGKALGSATRGLRGFIRLPAVAVQGLVQIGAAAGPAFERFGKAADGALVRFSDRLTSAFESGRMEQAIDHAVDLLKQIADVGGNVVSIIGSIFNAAEGTGGGTLGVLQQITAELAKIFQSKGVQDALHELFATMSEIGKVAAPLIGEALKQLAPVISALGPPARILIDAFGKGIQPIIKALGPVLLVAARAVGDIVVALSPLLPVVGQLVASLLPPLIPVFQEIGNIARELAPTIAQLAAQLGPLLTPIVQGLGEILKEIVEQSGDQFLEVFRQLVPLLPQLAPLFLQLAESGGELLRALAPLLPQITLLAVKLITELLPVILPLIPPLIELATRFSILATDVLVGVVIPAIQGVFDAIGKIKEKLQPAIDAAKKVTEGISKAFELLYDHLVGHSVIPDLLDRIVSLFSGLPGRAARALGNLASSISEKASSAGSAMVRAIEGKLKDAADAVRGLPGKAKSALGSLSGVLTSAGRSLIGGLISGIEQRFGDVRSKLTSLTNMLPDWKGPKRKDATLLTPAGKTLIKGLIDGIDASTASLKSKLGQVTTLIERAITVNKGNRKKVSGLGSLLSTVEKDNKKLLALATARDKAAATLKTAQAKLDGLVADRAKVVSSISGGILGDADITQSGGIVNSVTAITVGLQQSVKAAQAFATNITKLKKAGLRTDLLQEIADKGVSGGAATAQALAAATPAELKRINDLQAQLASAASKTGTAVGDALYKSGISAAQGLVDGLKSKEKTLEAQMERLGEAMVKAIKRKLDIHSPSRVAHTLGELFGTGLEQGALSTRRAVSAAGTTLAQTLSSAASTARSAVASVPAPGALTAAYAGSQAACRAP
ncbi:hypothetical protein [Streptomyces sp. MI02-7b]|uniref:hypothetical protein n=1 Tax=Streptomyces sp. MI02-7b TaxID=462941 RepID=UPI0029BD8105|nr:hypothetical protein [Streptomyces sp. MI02-7b]MDX3074625.1 hypothetical protein [Streptomyces sp. MI02-7b]